MSTGAANSDSGARADAGGDEFFVGFVSPPPRGVARAARTAAVVIMIAVVVVGALVAVGQRSPGRGVWSTTPRVWTGVFAAKPYPMLRAIDPETGAATTALLVREGKCGLMQERGYCGPPPGVASMAEFSELLGRLDGSLVELTATALRRDGYVVLEVLSAPAAAAEDPDLRKLLAVKASARTEPTLISGEIVDPKCFFGAMKPGEGATHRGCAVLCIEGGIPPVIVAYDASGRAVCLPIIGAGGEPAHGSMAPFAGDFVDMAGIVESHHGLSYLVFDGDNIQRR